MRTSEDLEAAEEAGSSVVAKPAASIYGTQPVITGAVQGSADAGPDVWWHQKVKLGSRHVCSVSSIKSPRSLDTVSAEALRAV